MQCGNLQNGNKKFERLVRVVDCPRESDINLLDEYDWNQLIIAIVSIRSFE